MSSEFDTAAPPPTVKGGANRDSSVRPEHHKIDRDTWGRYKLPDLDTGQIRAWRRATTLARTMTDEFTLNQWKQRKILEGIVRRQDLFALAAATEPEEFGVLNKIADQAADAAEANAGANNGTALHKFVQRLDLGINTMCPPWLQAYVDAYELGMQQHRLKTRPEYIERIVVNGSVQIAGQFDRIVFDPTDFDRIVFDPTDNVLKIADLKTAKLDSIQYAWLEIAIQLSCYAYADKVWDFATQRYIDMAEFAPGLDKTTALVLHLPNDVPERQANLIVYEIDLVRGWECAQIALQIHDRRSASKRYARLRPTPTSPAPTAKLTEQSSDGTMRSAPVTLPAGAPDSVPAEQPPVVGSEPRPEPSYAVGDTKIADENTIGVLMCTSCGERPPATLGARICARCAIEYALGKRAVTFGSLSPSERVLMCGSRAELQALWKTGTGEGWWTVELTKLGQEHLAKVETADVS